MAHTTAGPVPCIIGMDIGGTNCRIGGVCSDLKLMEPVAKYNSRALFNTDEPEQILIEMIDNFIRTHPNGTPVGICIGFPGTVNKTKDTVISCPNLLAFTNRNIAGPLEEHFHIPVVAEHDVLLLLSYDMKLLGLEDADCIVSFYLGTGLGNGSYSPVRKDRSLSLWKHRLRGTVLLRPGAGTSAGSRFSGYPSGIRFFPL